MSATSTTMFARAASDRQANLAEIKTLFAARTPAHDLVVGGLDKEGQGLANVTGCTHQMNTDLGEDDVAEPAGTVHIVAVDCAGGEDRIVQQTGREGPAAVGTKGTETRGGG